jgi:hypothetical protein
MSHLLVQTARRLLLDQIVESSRVGMTVDFRILDHAQVRPTHEERRVDGGYALIHCFPTDNFSHPDIF